MRRNDRRPEVFDRRRSYSDRDGRQNQNRDREPARYGAINSYRPLPRQEEDQRRQTSDSFRGDRSPGITSPTNMVSSDRRDSRPDNGMFLAYCVTIAILVLTLNFNSGPGHMSPSSLPKQPSDPAAASNHEKDISRMVSLLCERLYWYMQRDKQDKSERKARDELDRCKIGHPESSGISELLRMQIKQLEKEKNKCCARVGAADAKLLAAALPFVDQLNTRASESEGQKLTTVELDARLESLRGSIIVDCTKKINDDTSQMKTATMSEIESRTKELNQMLMAERSKNEQLQKRLDTLEKKMDCLVLADNDKASEAASKASAVADLGVKINSTWQRTEQLSAQYSSLSQAMTTQDQLEVIFNDFDEKISSSEEPEAPSKTAALAHFPGSKTRLCLQIIGAKVEELQSNMQKISNEKVLEAVNILHKRLDEVDTALAAHSLEQSGHHPDATAKTNTNKQVETGPSQILEEKLQQFTMAQISNTNISVQKKLNDVAQKLGGFIDNERKARLATVEIAGDSQAATAALRKDFDAHKDSYSQTIRQLEQEQHTQRTVVTGQISRLDAFNTSLASNMAWRGTIEEIAMQVQCVTAWQNNFNTKPLYRDIVEHINATLPSGTAKQVAALAVRLDALEGQLMAAGEGSLKRRKLQQNGTALYGGN